MKQNYSLEEIKKELFGEIEVLFQKEPLFERCLSCPFKGKCCIDNDIDIREDEWNLIKKRLDESEEIRNQVKDNFMNNRKCYFRTEKCCLIHEIRPTNCIYTPYQVVQNIYDKKIIYSFMDEECNFTTMEKEMDSLLDEKETYISIDKRTYLFLNHWYFAFENQSIDCFKMTGEERLREYFKDSL